MNKDELRSAWDNLHTEGLAGKSETEIEEIVRKGTSDVVSGINKNLFRDMVISAFAAVVCALGVVFFYMVFDPGVHTWIDLSRIVPIQILGFVVFLVLFLFGWLEYKLVNRSFTSDSVKAFLSTLLTDFASFRRMFTFLILVFLAITFFVELDFFFGGTELIVVSLKVMGSALLTGFSYWAITLYYRKTFKPYFDELSKYQRIIER